jgi:hypothetical protein
LTCSSLLYQRKWETWSIKINQVMSVMVLIFSSLNEFPCHVNETIYRPMNIESSVVIFFKDSIWRAVLI